MSSGTQTLETAETVVNAMMMKVNISISVYRHGSQEAGFALDGYELLKHLPERKSLPDKETLRRALLSEFAKLPKDWYGFELYAWGEIDPEKVMPTGQKVPYFFYENGTWKDSERWIGEMFDFRRPAIVYEDHRAKQALTDDLPGIDFAEQQ